MNLDPKAIPAAVREADRWLVWRLEEREGGKPTKVPYQAATPSTRASSTDPATWSTFDAALAALEEDATLTGVGFALGDGWSCVDLDHCRDAETGGVAHWASDLVSTLDSYTEVSPSGTGLHVLVRGAKPEGSRSRGPAPGDVEAEVEVYDDLRYVTVTGARWELSPSDEVAERSDELAALVEPWTSARPDRDPAGEPGEEAAYGSAAIPDDELLALAREAKNGEKFARLYDEGSTEGYPSPSEADAALLQMLAYWTGRDRPRMDRLYRESALAREKWDRDDYRERTLDHAIANCDEVYQPGERPEDFWVNLEGPYYIYRPTRRTWGGTAVNLRVGKIQTEDGEEVTATSWLIRHRGCQSMSWLPGEPEVVEDVIVADQDRIRAPGSRTYNLYQPPTIRGGDPAGAERWLELLRYLYPEEADHLIRWFAHRVQHPGEKPNHGIVLGGRQGIGKDTILEPLKAGVGERNFSVISPSHLLIRFNPWLKSVVLVVEEARDLGDMNRFALYEQTKQYLAAPPDFLLCDVKHMKTYPVANVMGVIFTTNHRDGVYIPADDRRHYVAWSETDKRDEAYFRDLWEWYGDGGLADVVAYLRQPERLEGFNPKAPPPRTAAWHEMMGVFVSSEEEDLAALLERLGNPPAITKEQLLYAATLAGPDFKQLHYYMHDSNNNRAFARKMEDVGYVRTPRKRRPDDHAPARWYIDGKQTGAVYCRRGPINERHAAAEALQRGGTPVNMDNLETHPGLHQDTPEPGPDEAF